MGFASPDDALHGVYMECAQDAWNVGRRTTPQFHVHGDDFRAHSFDFDFDAKPNKKPMVIVPFSSKQGEWPTLEGFDIHNKDRRGRFRRYRTTLIFTP
jgi:hypothetical protein